MAVLGILMVVYFGLQWWLYARQEASLRAHYSHVPVGFEETLTLSDHQKAADYGIAKLKLARLELLLEALLLGFWLLVGLNVLTDRLFSQQPASLNEEMAVILSVMAVGALIDLPISYYRTFNLEARFGFNQSTVGLFIKDQLLSLLVGGILGVPLLWFVLWALQVLGSNWWWVAFLGFAGFSLTLTLIWPSVIAPLFNRFKELENDTLKLTLNELLDTVGFTAKGVYVMDGSRRSTHGNAYFTGFGNSKRIVLFDTLIERLDSQEIRAVLAHELGHFKLNHIKRQLVVSLLLTFLGFAVVGFMSQSPALFAALGLSYNHASLLILCLLGLPLISWPIQPLMNKFSRRHEFEADAYASKFAAASDLGSALKKLVRDNASTLTPDPWYAGFYASHPSVIERLRALHS